MNGPEDNHRGEDADISGNLTRIVPDDLSPAGLVDGARRKQRQRRGVMGGAAALVLVALAVPVTLEVSEDRPLTAQPAITPSGLPEEEFDEVSLLPGAKACYTEGGAPISYQQDTSGPAELGAVRAWLCGDYDPETGEGVVGPVEPLTTGIDALIEGVQSEPEVDLAVISCLADYELTFNVVLEYDDGSRHIIGGERHGCHLTYDGGVVREGGEELYNDLITAWERQREADTETEEGDWGGEDACPGPLPMIPMELSGTVSGRICVEEINETGTTHSMAYLDELVDEVVVSMRDQWESPDQSPPPPASSASEQPFWLTLSNRYNDSLTLMRHDDGVYRTREGEAQERVWVPPQDLSVRLQEILEQGDIGAAVPPLPEPTEN